jgi:hypothetical protein
MVPPLASGRLSVDFTQDVGDALDGVRREDADVAC